MVTISKNLIISVILIILSTIVGVYLVVPARQKSGDLREKITKLEQDLIQQKRLKSRINSLFDDFSNQDSKKVDFVQNKIVPLSFDIPQLLIQMEALTSENGLIMNNISFATVASSTKQQTSTATLKTGSINLSLEGSYYAFKNFLRNVETNVRLMDAVSISFSSPKLLKDQPIPIFSFGVNLKTYYK